MKTHHQLLSVAAALVAFGAEAHAQSYTVTTLGLAPGYPVGMATSINDDGEIVGDYRIGLGSGPLWTLPGLTPTTVPAPAGATLWSAMAIAGDYMVGFDDSSDAILWTAGSPAVLAPFAGGTGMHAADVNTSGDVVGWGTNGSGAMVAVRWVGGSASALASGSATGCIGHAIDESGDVVGYCTIAGVQRATRWVGATRTTLSLPNNTVSSIANGTNDGGMIVGSSVNNSNKTFATRWLNGTAKLLQKSSAITSSVALAVNEDELIVGYATLTNGKTVGSYWIGLNTQVSLVSPSGYSHCRAEDVDNLGRIVGWCYNTPSDTIAVAWLP